MKWKGGSSKKTKLIKPLSRLVKKKGKRTRTNKIRNEKGAVTTDTTEIQRITRDACKWPQVNKMDSREEMETLRKVNALETESGRNRKYEHTHYQYWNWISNLKTPNKQKSRTRWLHRWILPIAWRRVNIYFPQIIPNNCRGRNVSEPNQQGQHHPDTKTR